MSRNAKRVGRGGETVRAQGADRPAPPWEYSRTTTIAALCLVLICAAPFALWGNPYPQEAVQYWLTGSAAALCIAGVAAAVPKGRQAAQSVVDSIGAMRASHFALAIGGVSFALSAFYALVVFRRGASSTDELAQLWHARVLLSGRLSLPADVDAEFFALDTVVDAIRWYSHFPIGWPAVLALGELLGVTWLINPLMCGLTSVALYAFGRRAYDERTGRLIGITCALSPSVVIMAGTLMSQSVVLALVAWAFVALVHWEASRETRRTLWLSAGIGALLGIAATIRPVDALIAAVVIGTLQCVVFLRAPSRLRTLPAQLIAGMLCVAPLLYANARTTGHPLRFGYEMQWGAAHSIGFHVDPYGRDYTLMHGFERLLSYVSELNMYVTAWPVPALLLTIISLLLIRRVSRWDVLLLAHFVLQALVYASYSLEGEFLGPRFLFTALPTLIVFIARLPIAVTERLEGGMRRGALTFLAACLAITWCVPRLPLNAWGLGTIAATARQQLRLDLKAAIRDAKIEQGLVFLREPFGARLTRRLWGLGISRSQSAILLARRDACSVHSAVVRLEQAPSTPLPAILAELEGTTLLDNGPSAMESTDRVLQFNGPASITGACRAEIDSDSTAGFVPFGLGLPLESFDASGRISGGLVFVADLGEHNEALRTRFSDRPWYRMRTTRAPDGRVALAVEPYR